MKKNLLTLSVLFLSSMLPAQVGINTSNPQGVFNIDGAKDNAATGTPTIAQQINDVFVTPTGSLGVGIIPITKLHVEGSEARFSNGTSRWGLTPEGVSPTSRISIIDRSSNIRRLILSENGDTYIGGNLGTGGETSVIRVLAGVSGNLGNVGINVFPGTSLDVNGAITNRETAVAISGNTATIPPNFSQVRITGAATASITVSVPTAPPNSGQRLILYNTTTGGFSAVLNGFTIDSGQAVEFTYSNGSWISTNGGATASRNLWNVLGNAGTTPATNFLGTTDSQDMVVRTNNSERMRVLAGGNVGIGTSAPLSRLHIEGSEVRFSNTTSTWALSPTAGGTAGASHSFEIVDRINNVRRMIFNDNGDVSLGGGIVNNGTGGILSIRNTANAVSIGWLNNTPVTTYRLNVNGDINAVGAVRANGVVLTSDSRLKRNIEDSPYGLKAIMALRPVEYEKKNTIEDHNYSRHEVGFIAQEVAKVLPSLVVTGSDHDKTLSVSYIEVIPILTKAIQEQQSQIKNLKQKYADLEKRMLDLEKKLAPNTK